MKEKLKRIALGLGTATAVSYVGVDQYQERVPTDYVIVKDVNARVVSAQSDLETRLSKFKNKTKHGKGYRLRLNKEEAKELEAPGVIVEPLISYSLPKPAVKAKVFTFGCNWQPPAPEPEPEPLPPPTTDAEVIDWGVARVKSTVAFSKGVTGSTVKVCVLDTGVDRLHPDLRVSGGFNFTSANSSDYADRQGHGTHTAGLVAAVFGNLLGVSGASQAELFIGKVLDDEGSGYNDWIANGIIWSVSSKCKIISMSLGGPNRSAVIESAVVYAKNAGVKIIVAAGNDSSSSVGYPAGYVYPGTIYSVSATNKSDKLAYFSNYGKVEMACPGEGIRSTVPGGYDTYSGTSMATPICAGVVALYLSVGKEIVYDPIGSSTQFGAGIPNAEGALK